jgi:hypothetical protein
MTKPKLDRGLYERLLKVLKESGERASRTAEDEAFRVLSLGDVQATFAQKTGGWKLEALTFTVLDQDFFVEEDGIVSLAVFEDDEALAYPIEDAAFLKGLERFLEWRLEMHSTFAGG